VQAWSLDGDIFHPCNPDGPISVAGVAGQLEFDFTLRQCDYQLAGTQASVVLSVTTNLTADIYTSDPLYFMAISS
jgi:hypothetical protein